MQCKWKRNLPMDMDELREMISKLSARRSKKRIIACIFLGIAVIAAIGGAVWYVLQRNKDNDDDYDDYDDFDDDYEEYDSDEDCNCTNVVKEEIAEIEKEKLAEELEEAMQTELKDGDQNEETQNVENQNEEEDSDIN
ncbi:hypothetical protein [Defluviitalea saccharophila]|uniref:DUF4366 domain-containing protein n=1 Tax=Defluviitalea saccharophila TaxID=879970 RepID=A0ABZ2Y383_9FIRM|nr:hypothetical protein [Candidatus Epulonipiscium sp.]